MELRCWQCGVEPEEVFEVTTLAEARPRYVPGRWPVGDHPHAFEPPSPGELARAGDAAAGRILAIAAE